MTSTPSLLKLSQCLTGRLSTYTLTKQLGESIWLGRCLASSSNAGETVIIKAARHFRITNERDILRKFQRKTPHLRPLIDEIIEPADPPAIVLKHLQDDLMSASATKRLNGKQIRYVSKRVLKALKSLHEDGYVHAGQYQILDQYQMDNVLVNYAPSSETVSEPRFTDVQLADLESTVHTSSRYCEDRDEIGTPI
ncbi:hypothetical protein DPV78_002497 [Talaromyces pinophilus]|nr:hypothetical protein DPV78_002497 [Talaromyces pinophilus]